MCLWNLDFAKMNDRAKKPEKGHESDAGYDLFCSEEQEVYLGPGMTAVFGTGLKVALPSGYVMEIKNRSGVAAKKSLLVGACIIDPGYDGEIKINLHNVGLESQTVSPGDKIAQFVVYPVESPAINLNRLKSVEDQNAQTSSRLDGSFGSTGMK